MPFAPRHGNRNEEQRPKPPRHELETMTRFVKHRCAKSTGEAHSTSCPAQHASHHHAWHRSRIMVPWTSARLASRCPRQGPHVRSAGRARTKTGGAAYFRSNGLYTWLVPRACHEEQQSREVATTPIKPICDPKSRRPRSQRGPVVRGGCPPPPPRMSRSTCILCHGQGKPGKVPSHDQMYLPRDRFGTTLMLLPGGMPGHELCDNDPAYNRTMARLTPTLWPSWRRRRHTGMRGTAHPDHDAP